MEPKEIMIEQLIQKYLIGSANENEMETLLGWLEEDPSNQKMFFQLKDVWDATSIENFESEQKAWKTLMDKLKPKNTNKTNQVRRIVMPLLRLAAMLLLFAGLGWLGYYLYNAKQDQFFAYQQQITKRGETTQLTLNDGSKVWVNAASKFKFPSKFDGDIREVYLEGEAFFEVAKNPHKPFIVRTANLSIKVLGTSFNVMSYPDDETVETTLVEGKVSISEKQNQKSNEVVLQPNEKATYSKSEKNITLESVNTQNYTGWKNGKLVFDNESFESVVKKLERRYNVDFVIDNSILKKYRYTLTIKKESLEEVLEVIRLTTPVKYKINGKKVYIEENEDAQIKQLELKKGVV